MNRKNADQLFPPLLVTRSANPGKAASKYSIRPLAGGLLAVLVFAASWYCLGHWWYAHGRIVDTPIYQGYGLQMRNGLLPYRDFSVEYPPGAVEHIHRHNASAFVYVLEGTIVEGVRGAKEVTLTPGQTFYEGPDDVHTVGRNASATKPAKFVVVLVKKKGVDAVLPAE